MILSHIQRIGSSQTPGRSHEVGALRGTSQPRDRAVRRPFFVMAWVLTLPAAIMLSASLYVLFANVF